MASGARNALRLLVERLPHAATANLYKRVAQPRTRTLRSCDGVGTLARVSPNRAICRRERSQQAGKTTRLNKRRSAYHCGHDVADGDAHGDGTSESGRWSRT